MKILLTTLILVGLISMSSLASASNLLTNASFEDSAQDPWIGAWGDDKHTFVYGDITYAHSGTNSFKVIPNSNAGAGQDYCMYPNNRIAATPGQTYYGYIYAKTDSLVNEEAMVVLDFFKADGTWCKGTQSPTITRTNDWTLLSVKDVAPNEAAFVSLIFRVRKVAEKGSGIVYFDDAYLDTTSLKKETKERR